MPLFDVTAHRMICSKGDFTDVYSIQQVNGQLVATFKHVPHPKRGTEIFIKKLPRNILLGDIFEFAVRCGDIYRIRLLMDFSGFNRGYCFVTYFEVNSARKAILTLNGDKIMANCSVFVKLSFDNNKLEMRGIPQGINRDEIFRTMSEIIGIGLMGIITFKKTNSATSTNKCVLKYDTHRHALEARKKVWPVVKLWKKNIEIDWAVPNEVLNQSKRLYFQNAPKEITKLQLYDEVIKYIEPFTMLNMFLQDGLGYLLFVSGSDAFDAYLKLRAQEIYGKILEFSFTKFYPRLQAENKTSNLEEADSSDNLTDTILSDNMNETQSSSTQDSSWGYASSSTEDESIAIQTSSASVSRSVTFTGNSSIGNEIQSSSSSQDSSWGYVSSSTEEESNGIQKSSTSVARNVTFTGNSLNGNTTQHSEPSFYHYNLPVQSEHQWPIQPEQYSSNMFSSTPYAVENIVGGNPEFMNNCFPTVLVPSPIITLSGPYDAATEIHQCVSHYFNFNHQASQWIYTCTNERVNPNTLPYNNMVRVMPIINHVQYDLTLVQVPRMEDYHLQ